ncbi:MAG TPA: serine--tRNA ligase [Candidatus Paceibacterota bacterium]
MLDINFIKENIELVKEAVRKKRVSVDIDLLLSVDEKRRGLQRHVEEKRAKQNEVTEKIAQTSSPTERESLIKEMQSHKGLIKKDEDELKEVVRTWQKLMVMVPNVPDMSVPEGDSDEENQEVKKWGEKPTFEFTPRNHSDLMKELDMADFERGVKVAGFRGYFLKNDGALLAWAVWQYAQSFFMQKGFTPIIVPSLVRKESFIGTGYLPQSEDDLYKTQDDEYLAGTAEVATMGYFMDETLTKESLPHKFLAFSPCFRREAGSHGKDTNGLIRVHEFYKWEQVVLCEASHEESVKWHEWLNKNTEEFIESLGIPYRVVVNCSGDLGLGQVKKYDIELWVPGEEKYREISSASYFHDFQTRRLNIRYKDSDGKSKYTHSLNGTAAPTPRILVSLVENYQQADGSIVIPEVLRSYMGKDVIRREN